MAKNQSKRLSPKLLAADIYALAALDNAKDYAPTNTNFTASVAQGMLTAMQKLQALESQAEGSFKAARDASVGAEWDLHNTMLGIKQQVIAQYGDNSNEIQGLGLKKKKEYKSRGSKKINTGSEVKKN